MKLFKKDQTPTRQRRISDDLGRPAPNLSYHSRRTDEDLNTGRKIQRTESLKALSFKRMLWFHRVILIAVVLVVFIGILVSLRLSSDAQISLESNDTSGLFAQYHSAYQTAVQSMFASSVWNHNKITVNTDQISQKLMTEFPELTDVSITIPFLGHQPTVYVNISQPALVLNDNKGSYVLDNSGKVLVNNDSSSSFETLNLPKVSDQSGLVLQRNHQALPSSYVSFIQTVVAQLQAKQDIVSSLTLPPATNELDVRLVGQPYIIRFNLENNDPRQQAGTFLAVQANLKSQNSTPSQYVDVRVDGRAYYQ